MNETLKGWLAAIFWIVVIVGGIWLLSRDTSGTVQGSGDGSNSPDPSGYSSCSEAHDDGVYDIPEGDPAYKSKQDADHDGFACEHYLGN